MSDFDVGNRLKEIRVAAGMSQRRLAEISGVPHGQISMIETNRSSPSVASLRKIIGGLGITMSEFFEPDTAHSGAFFFKPHELRDLTTRLYSTLGSGPGGNGPGEHGMGHDGIGRITMRQVGDARAHNLQILHERYEPGADTGEAMLEHVSSEGGIVISGELELTVGSRTAILKAGDAFLFSSTEPHRFRNVSDRDAVVVSACTPPYL